VVVVFGGELLDWDCEGELEDGSINVTLDLEAVVDVVDDEVNEVVKALVDGIINVLLEGVFDIEGTGEEVGEEVDEVVNAVAKTGQDPVFVEAILETPIIVCASPFAILKTPLPVEQSHVPAST